MIKRLNISVSMKELFNTTYIRGCTSLHSFHIRVLPSTPYKDLTFVFQIMSFYLSIVSSW